MSGSKNNSDDSSINKSIDVSMLEEFIEIQKNRISIENSELELKKQHLKTQSEIAKQTLSIQEKLLAKAPKEKRKNRMQYFVFGKILTVIILSFCLVCLIYDFEKFLTYLIGVLSHLGVLWLGYYFGVHNNRKKEDEEDTDIM